MSERTPWALILGASSGFGAATAKALARAGMNVIGVHFDMRATLPLAKAVQAEIEGMGRQALFFNKDAVKEENRQEIVAGIAERFADGQHTVKVLLHSIAWGTLKPFIHEDPKQRIAAKDMSMTLDAMANSLVYWTQDLLDKGWMHEGARIFGMTSAGSHRVWTSYGAVSAAKAALESHCRQLALELAPRKITANAIQAGVTDTPALRKIPGSAGMVERAMQINPTGRLTTPEDVAAAVVQLCHQDLSFLTGNTIRVDGGEDNVS